MAVARQPTSRWWNSQSLFSWIPSAYFVVIVVLFSLEFLAERTDAVLMGCPIAFGSTTLGAGSYQYTNCASAGSYTISIGASSVTLTIDGTSVFQQVTVTGAFSNVIISVGGTATISNNAGVAIGFGNTIATSGITLTGTNPTIKSSSTGCITFASTVSTFTITSTSTGATTISCAGHGIDFQSIATGVVMGGTTVLHTSGTNNIYFRGSQVSTTSISYGATSTFTSTGSSNIVIVPSASPTTSSIVSITLSGTTGVTTAAAVANNIYMSNIIYPSISGSAVSFSASGTNPGNVMLVSCFGTINVVTSVTTYGTVTFTGSNKFTVSATTLSSTIIGNVVISSLSVATVWLEGLYTTTQASAASVYGGCLNFGGFSSFVGFNFNAATFSAVGGVLTNGAALVFGYMPSSTLQGVTLTTVSTNFYADYSACVICLGGTISGMAITMASPTFDKASTVTTVGAYIYGSSSISLGSTTMTFSTVTWQGSALYGINMQQANPLAAPQTYYLDGLAVTMTGGGNVYFQRSFINVKTAFNVFSVTATSVNFYSNTPTANGYFFAHYNTANYVYPSSTATLTLSSCGLSGLGVGLGYWYYVDGGNVNVIGTTLTTTGIGATSVVNANAKGMFSMFRTQSNFRATISLTSGVTFSSLAFFHLENSLGSIVSYMGGTISLSAASMVSFTANLLPAASDGVTFYFQPVSITLSTSGSLFAVDASALVTTTGVSTVTITTSASPISIVADRLLYDVGTVYNLNMFLTNCIQVYRAECVSMSSQLTQSLLVSMVSSPLTVLGYVVSMGSGANSVNFVASGAAISITGAGNNYAVMHSPVGSTLTGSLSINTGSVAFSGAGTNYDILRSLGPLQSFFYYIKYCGTISVSGTILTTASSVSSLTAEFTQMQFTSSGVGLIPFSLYTGASLVSQSSFYFDTSSISSKGANCVSVYGVDTTTFRFEGFTSQQMITLTATTTAIEFSVAPSTTLRLTVKYASITSPSFGLNLKGTCSGSCVLSTGGINYWTLATTNIYTNTFIGQMALDAADFMTASGINLWTTASPTNAFQFSLGAGTITTSSATLDNIVIDGGVAQASASVSFVGTTIIGQRYNIKVDGYQYNFGATSTVLSTTGSTFNNIYLYTSTGLSILSGGFRIVSSTLTRPYTGTSSATPSSNVLIGLGISNTANVFSLGSSTFSGGNFGVRVQIRADIPLFITSCTANVLVSATSTGFAFSRMGLLMLDTCGTAASYSSNAFSMTGMTVTGQIISQATLGALTPTVYQNLVYFKASYVSQTISMLSSSYGFSSSYAAIRFNLLEFENTATSTTSLNSIVRIKAVNALFKTYRYISALVSNPQAALPNLYLYRVYIECMTMRTLDYGITMTPFAANAIVDGTEITFAGVYFPLASAAVYVNGIVGTTSGSSSKVHFDNVVFRGMTLATYAGTLNTLTMTAGCGTFNGGQITPNAFTPNSGARVSIASPSGVCTANTWASCFDTLSQSKTTNFSSTVSQTTSYSVTPTFSEEVSSSKSTSSTTSPSMSLTDEVSTSRSLSPTNSDTFSMTEQKSLSDSLSVSPTLSMTMSDMPTDSKTVSITDSMSSSPSESPTSALSSTRSVSTSESTSTSLSPTFSISDEVSASRSGSESVSLTQTMTITLTSTTTISESPEPSVTLTLMPTPTASQTQSRSRTLTDTLSISSSPTESASPTVTDEITASTSESISWSLSESMSSMPSASRSLTLSSSFTDEKSSSRSMTITYSSTITLTLSQQRSHTPTQSPSPSRSATTSISFSESTSTSESVSPSTSSSDFPTSSDSVTISSTRGTPSFSKTSTRTRSVTSTMTDSVSSSPTDQQTDTRSASVSFSTTSSSSEEATLSFKTFSLSRSASVTKTPSPERSRTNSVSNPWNSQTRSLSISGAYKSKTQSYGSPSLTNTTSLSGTYSESFTVSDSPTVAAASRTSTYSPTGTYTPSLTMTETLTSTISVSWVRSGSRSTSPTVGSLSAFPSTSRSTSQSFSASSTRAKSHTRMSSRTETKTEEVTITATRTFSNSLSESQGVSITRSASLTASNQPWSSTRSTSYSSQPTITWSATVSVTRSASYSRSVSLAAKSKTETFSPTFTISTSPTKRSASPVDSNTFTPSGSRSPTPSSTPSETPQASNSVSHSDSRSPSFFPSVSRSTSTSDSRSTTSDVSASRSLSASQTLERSLSRTHSVSSEATGTVRSASLTVSESVSTTPTKTIGSMTTTLTWFQLPPGLTKTQSPTVTITRTPTRSTSLSLSTFPSESRTVTLSLTEVRSNTRSDSHTVTETQTVSTTESVSNVQSSTKTHSPSVSLPSVTLNTSETKTPSFEHTRSWATASKSVTDTISSDRTQTRTLLWTETGSADQTLTTTQTITPPPTPSPSVTLSNLPVYAGNLQSFMSMFLSTSRCDSNNTFFAINGPLILVIIALIVLKLLRFQLPCIHIDTYLKVPQWRSLLVQHSYLALIIPCHVQCFFAHYLLFFLHANVLLLLVGAIALVYQSTTSIQATYTAVFASIAAQAIRPFFNWLFYRSSIRRLRLQKRVKNPDHMFTSIDDEKRHTADVDDDNNNDNIGGGEEDRDSDWATVEEEENLTSEYNGTEDEIESITEPEPVIIEEAPQLPDAPERDATDELFNASFSFDEDDYHFTKGHNYRTAHSVGTATPKSNGGGRDQRKADKNSHQQQGHRPHQGKKGGPPSSRPSASAPASDVTIDVDSEFMVAFDEHDDTPINVTHVGGDIDRKSIAVEFNASGFSGGGGAAAIDTISVGSFDDFLLADDSGERESKNGNNSQRSHSKGGAGGSSSPRSKSGGGGAHNKSISDAAELKSLWSLDQSYSGKEAPPLPPPPRELFWDPRRATSEQSYGDYTDKVFQLGDIGGKDVISASSGPGALGPRRGTWMAGGDEQVDEDALANLSLSSMSLGSVLSDLSSSYESGADEFDTAMRIRFSVRTHYLLATCATAIAAAGAVVLAYYVRHQVDSIPQCGQYGTAVPIVFLIDLVLGQSGFVFLVWLGRYIQHDAGVKDSVMFSELHPINDEVRVMSIHRGRLYFRRLKESHQYKKELERLRREGVADRVEKVVAEKHRLRPAPQHVELFVDDEENVAVSNNNGQASLSIEENIYKSNAKRQEKQQQKQQQKSSRATGSGSAVSFKADGSSSSDGDVDAANAKPWNPDTEDFDWLANSKRFASAPER